MLESNITVPSSADEVTKEWLKEVLSSSFPHATFTSLEGKRNERLKGAPLTLLHGDFHLDNIVFEKLTEPVFLDWSHPLIGGPAYNLVTLLFYMTPLKYFGKVIDCYLGEFNELAKSKLNRTRLEKQLGGEFLRSFAIATCGVARWQPESERGFHLLDASIRKLNIVADFWQSRDPAIFSFLH